MWRGTVSRTSSTVAWEGIVSSRGTHSHSHPHAHSHTQHHKQHSHQTRTTSAQFVSSSLLPPLRSFYDRTVEGLSATLDSPRSFVPQFTARLQQMIRFDITAIRNKSEPDFPQLTYQQTAFNQSVLSRAESLRLPFRPTPWMTSRHAQTVFGTLLRIRPGIVYQREIMPLSDGAAVALDWDTGRTQRGDVRFLPHHPTSPLATPSNPSVSTQPILILFPGLTGGSRSKYLCQLVELSRSAGFQTLVFNFRGINHPMLTPKPSTGINVEDLIETFEHLQRCYPHAPKTCIAFSMGANMMVKTLGQLQQRATKELGIVACAAVSCAFDFVKLTKALHDPINELLYSRFLTYQLKRNYIKQPSVQKIAKSIRIDVDHALKSRTIIELDDRFTRHMYGLTDVTQYYDKQSSKYLVKHVQTPLLCLNALDDPFEGELPMDDIRSNPHIILATTKQGGHVAWASGMNPLRKGSSWMMTTTLDFLKAALQVSREQSHAPVADSVSASASMQASKRDHSPQSDYARKF